MKYFFFIAICSFFIISCDKEIIINQPDVELIFSSDTILFDTIFTTLGSTTKSLIVKNPSNRKITISSIEIPNKNSHFSINIDGSYYDSLEDFIIYPKDSIYIFVQANINAQDNDLPVFIKDSIEFKINSKVQDVKLLAYGQDVVIKRSEFINSDETWEANKSILIMDSVTVLANSTLYINEGVNIYFYKDAKLKIQGNIIADGKNGNPIIFKGDRHDDVWQGYNYEDISGYWSGIEIEPSERTNILNYCIIKGAINGLTTGKVLLDSICKVDLNNTIIHNNLLNGLTAIYSNINLKNCVITNSGDYNVFLVSGGSYNFYHCTLANYYGKDIDTKREESSVCLAITNAIVYGNYIFYNDLKEANFYNCIIDGNNENEAVFGLVDNIEFNFNFNSCTLKMQEEILNDFSENFIDCYFNPEIDYAAVDRYNYDFQLDSASFAIDKGNPEFTTKFDCEMDINGMSRIIDGYPDIGAYEFQKEN